MSSYHSFELCYLAAVYNNLLISKQPMDLHFKPQVGGFKDNILHIQPDILPAGSVRIESVWINGEPYRDFDPVAMTVQLPVAPEQSAFTARPEWAGNPPLVSSSKQELKVRVRIAPTGIQFDGVLDVAGDVAHLTLFGNLTDSTEPAFKVHLDKIIAARPKRVVLHMENLETMSRQPALALSFFSEKLALEDSIDVVGVNAQVKEILQKAGVWESLNLLQAAKKS